MRREELLDVELIISSPYWGLSGANIFSLYLAKALDEVQIPNHILITWPHAQQAERMELPDDVDVEFLPVEEDTTWRDRCYLLKRYLEARAPCIYFPNHDYQLSPIVSRLSDQVGVIGILHSDDPRHYEHFERLGDYWNAAVAVSSLIAKNARKRRPELNERIHVIEYGVSVPVTGEKRSENFSDLTLIYAGRIVQHQKRVFDLIKLMELLRDRNCSVHLEVAGDGPDRERFCERASELMDAGYVRVLGSLPHDELLEKFNEADVFVSTSAFEGLPIALLEAMAHGCIPVVSNVESGVPEVVDHGQNGHRIAVGDVSGFADCISSLQKDPNVLETLSERARNSLREKSFSLERMRKDYVTLVFDIREKIKNQEFTRPSDALRPPPYIDLSWKHHLPTSVRRWGSAMKQMLMYLWSG